jgi:hypothetical protein
VGSARTFSAEIVQESSTGQYSVQGHADALAPLASRWVTREEIHGWPILRALLFCAAVDVAIWAGVELTRWCWRLG